MFTPKFNAVIPIDHRYLAEFDGSELAAGRGSGLEVKLNPEQGPPNPPNPVPYMNMTFAPVERRLDMAVFRALFASSARQARQFVIHGKVKVNGKKVQLRLRMFVDGLLTYWSDAIPWISSQSRRYVPSRGRFRTVCHR